MPARILVVEASHEVRALIVDVLTTDGHEVTGAANGTDALVIIELGAAFDLILGDLTIPGITGAHLYWEITRRWPQLTSRLICVTDGHSAGVSDHPILRVAAVPVVEKPFQPEHLRDVVETSVNLAFPRFHGKTIPREVHHGRPRATSLHPGQA